MRRVIQRQITTIQITSIEILWDDEPLSSAAPMQTTASLPVRTGKAARSARTRSTRRAEASRKSGAASGASSKMHNWIAVIENCPESKIKLEQTPIEAQPNLKEKPLC